MGEVVAVDKEGGWVDIGAKSEVLIPAQEMKCRLRNPLQVGEEVLVYVVEPQDAEGHILLSLDRARKFAAWYRLERYLSSGEPLEALVTSFNRGGLIVHYDGVKGFIPLSQIDGANRMGYGSSWLQSKVGEKLKLKVIEVNREQGRLILSHKAVVEAEKEGFLSQIEEGEIRKGRVTGVHDFGLFVDIGGVEGLVPYPELSWVRGKKPQEVAQTGEEVEVLVLKVDVEARKLLLSLKQAAPHPWKRVLEKYEVGQMVSGTVSRLFPFGAIVRLDDSIEGLAHISELASKHIFHPKEVVRVGQTLSFKIVSIDLEKRHLRLSLKQAEEG